MFVLVFDSFCRSNFGTWERIIFRGVERPLAGKFVCAGICLSRHYSLDGGNHQRGLFFYYCQASVTLYGVSLCMEEVPLTPKINNNKNVLIDE